MALAAPVAPCASHPAVKHLAILEDHAAVEACHEVGQLRLGLIGSKFVNDFEGHGHDRAGVIAQRSLGHEYQELSVAQARENLRRGLLARKLTEILFDVLDLEGT